MVYLVLFILLTVVAAGLCGIVILMMAIHMLKPPRMNDGKALYFLGRLDPGDLELSYENMDFVIRDTTTGKPLNIAGWWLPAIVPVDQTVILLHGYSDAKVGGIAWAPMWQSLGWNVLAIDQRAHGQSGGTHSTAGYFEQHDLNQVIDQLKIARSRSTQKLALFGVSLGAAVVAAVGTQRDDLHAIVMESPYSDFQSAIIQHGKRLGMPLEWAYPYAMRLANKISGAKLDQVKPIDLIPKIRAPLLVIHSGNDTFVPKTQIEMIQQALAIRASDSITVHQLIPDSEHTLGLAKDPDHYQRILADFLSTVSAQPADQTGSV